MPDLPARIGSVEFEQFGAKWVAVRCPSDFDGLMRKTGGLREAGSRRWLIHRWRINPLLRELRRSTDPLLRQAGIDLDGEGNRCTTCGRVRCPDGPIDRAVDRRCDWGRGPWGVSWSGLRWCGGCCRDPHRHHGLPPQAPGEEAEGGRDRGAGE